MHLILNDHYKQIRQEGITFADLGHSTANLNFFVTSSVTHSLTLSSGGSISKKEEGALMGKLIQLTSEGKFSIIDSIVEKVSRGELSRKVPRSAFKASLNASL
jgi:hypothetical protein